MPDLIAQYENGEIDLDQMIRKSSEKRASERRENGVVYTPLHIAREMVEMADVRLSDKIWEPSCGHGAFVFPIIEKIIDLCGDVRQAKFWFIQNVIASDLDAATVNDLREMVAAFFRGHNMDSVSTDFINITQMNALDKDFDRRFTLTIGNPPYVRTRAMNDVDLSDLRSRFGSMKKGNVDLYYAFIERAVEISDRVVFIVPNACLTASGAAALREITFPKLRELRDFGSDLPFQDARAYVAIMRFGLGDEPVKVRKGLDGPESTQQWRSLARDDLRGSPSVALSGIATLADKCFMLSIKDGQPYSELTEEFVERGVVRPLIKVTKPNTKRLILYPYSGRVPITENDMRSLFPAALRHFEKAREILEGRDKGKTENYPAWFAYGRSQGLHDLSSGRFIMVPVMIGGASLPFELDTTEMTRHWGAPLFTSGFAVPRDKDPAASLLNNEFLDFVRQSGRPKPGGANGDYYAISSRHVNSWLAHQT